MEYSENNILFLKLTLLIELLEMLNTKEAEEYWRNNLIEFMDNTRELIKKDMPPYEYDE